VKRPAKNIRKRPPRASLEPSDASIPQDGLGAHLEWCLRHKNRPELAQHPVVAALLDLYIVRLKAIVAWPPKVRALAVLLAPRPELDDLLELGSWVLRKGPRHWPDEERDQLISVFERTGFSNQGAKMQTRGITSRSGGRPASRRPVAIAALELKLRKPSLSWIEVTRELCNCGREKAEHDDYCKAKLLTRFKELRKLLRKHHHRFGTIKFARE
jgi:hypothetical protein